MFVVIFLSSLFQLTQLLADMEKRIKTKGLSVCLNQDQSKQGGKTMARFFGLGAMLPSLLEIAKQVRTPSLSEQNTFLAITVY